MLTHLSCVGIAAPHSATECSAALLPFVGLTLGQAAPSILRRRCIMCVVYRGCLSFAYTQILKLPIY